MKSICSVIQQNDLEHYANLLLGLNPSLEEVIPKPTWETWVSPVLRVGRREGQFQKKRKKYINLLKQEREANTVESQNCMYGGDS